MTRDVSRRRATHSDTPRARVAQIISGIDTPSAIDTDVVQVQNGIAVDIAAMVAELLETQGADPTQKINVVGDPRSNAIIIRAGSPERTELARNLIYKLDNAQSNPSNMHVVYLRNAQAGKLAQSLRGLLTGESESGVSDEARNKLSAMGGNSLNTTAGGAAQTGSGTPTGSSVQAVYGQTGAATTATSGTSAASDQNTAFSAGGVTIQADATTNTLLISAPDPLYLPASHSRHDVALGDEYVPASHDEQLDSPELLILPPSHDTQLV